MEKILLYSQKSENIKVTIEAYFDERDCLVIDGYDIGKTVEEYWGDSDYEYATTVPPEEVEKLYALFSLPTRGKEDLLRAIHSHFHTARCYSEFQKFLTDNGIRSEGTSWV